MKLVFATNNQNKVREVQKLMPTHIQLLSLSDIGCNEDIPETSPTIEGNAIQKTLYIKEHYGYDCFADDTGLEVVSLNGEPGVYSARYAGKEKDANANMDKLLTNLKKEQNRNAQFKTVIALSISENMNTFTGICKGIITEEKKGDQGFGYDPIFSPNGYDETFAELSLNQKNSISHRAQAVKKLILFLNS
ncbi:XTP/dITP diphosphohydrolase [Aquimarina amphilecti]|uniref:dITP/XTP pyrophosphatase n=1 Tax=Aquimarina amphilecti TaxID=1038014 RepID=A0A1H7FN91_AQUAM|nr:non-canonical purine NTP diphosphatase [Aquimarina amphilecti]SEK25922.1 XTP/dITP diphosphohydrolase [Aquimarina amphilecti]